MATDGVTLFYNPAFVDTLNAAELAGVLAHEVMHPALQHHTRRGDRNRKRWNMACDFPSILYSWMPGSRCQRMFSSTIAFAALSAERIYNLIVEQQDQDGSNGEGEKAVGAAPGGEGGKQTDNKSAGGEPIAPATPGGFGQVLDSPEPEGDDGDTVAEQAREWKIAVEQAENVAKLAGKLPAGVIRSLEQSEAAGVDWRELLRRAWSETIPFDYSWMPPNRRHIWAGLYLPGVRSAGAGEIAIAVDCSGSINPRQLGLFEAEIRSILEGQRPSRVHVLYFDTEVHKAEVFQAGQPIALTPVGGGGTNFAPCFRWLDEHGIVAQTLVFLTDLCGAFPSEAPAYPVLWAPTESRRAPFGQVIPMEAA
jgi:predicted metal-dependent peptidase